MFRISVQKFLMEMHPIQICPTTSSARKEKKRTDLAVAEGRFIPLFIHGLFLWQFFPHWNS